MNKFSRVSQLLHAAFSRVQRVPTCLTVGQTAYIRSRAVYSCADLGACISSEPSDATVMQFSTNDDELVFDDGYECSVLEHPQPEGISPSFAGDGDGFADEEDYEETAVGRK